MARPNTIFKRRSWLAFASAVTLAAALLGSPTPAQAADGMKCGAKQTKSFNLPNKNDITMQIYLCYFSLVSGRTQSQIFGRWWFNTLPPLGSSHRMDRVVVNVNTEHRDTKDGADRLMNSGVCDWTNFFNRDYQTADDEWYVCPTAVTNYFWQGYWSADAIIYYDIDNDGEGQYRWDVTGTPLW